MDSNIIIKTLEDKLKQSNQKFIADLKSLRTGRANPSMLETVIVEAYDTTMPLNQLATISVVDATLLQVTPFDPNNLENIASAIRNNQALGFNPSDDGRVVRIPVPPLTEERRKEIARQISQKLEESLVRERNFRHDALNALDKLKKDKTISEDEYKRIEKQINDKISDSKKDSESLAADKEKEVMTL